MHDHTQQELIKNIYNLYKLRNVLSKKQAIGFSILYR